MKPLLQTKGSKKRRELKTGGIYSITCTANGKVYIGSTVEFKKRWGQHRSELKKGTHCSNHLQRAYEKYGSASLDYQIVEYVKYADQLQEAEQRWIYWFQAHDREKGFNSCPIAGSTFGRERGQEEREKISRGLKKAYERYRLENPESVYTIQDVIKDGVTNLDQLSTRNLKKIGAVFRISRYSYKSKEELITSLLLHPRIVDIIPILSSCLSINDQIIAKIPPRLGRPELAKMVRDAEKEDARQEKITNAQEIATFKLLQEQDTRQKLLQKISKEPFCSVEECDIRTLKIISRIIKLRLYSTLTKAELIERISVHKEKGIIEKALNKY